MYKELEWLRAAACLGVNRCHATALLLDSLFTFLYYLILYLQLEAPQSCRM